MLTFAGLDCKKFGLHSPCIGGATDALVNKVPNYVIDKQGRWKSSNIKYIYLLQKESDLVKHILLRIHKFMFVSRRCLLVKFLIVRLLDSNDIPMSFVF